MRVERHGILLQKRLALLIINEQLFFHLILPINSIMATLIPENVKGKKNDLFESVHVPTEEEAAFIFQQASNRMSNPFNWHELTDLPAKFLPAKDHDIDFSHPLQEGSLQMIWDFQTL